MCVTAEPAFIDSTRTYVYATELDGKPVHVSGYQNKVETTMGGNCMFLNFAGSNLKLVRGPEHTHNFMDDMTSRLPELVYTSSGRSIGSFSYGSRDIFVEDYGDYTVILAQGPDDILSVLELVPEHRRPIYSLRLQAMVNFYMSWSDQDSFVLACFDGTVKPTHPITVSYTPRNSNVLTIPGLDGHDGKVPTVGAPVYRDFRVAFAIKGLLSLPFAVRYTDPGIAGMPWAPSHVTGFTDNRHNGPNGDYIVPIEAVYESRNGRDLVKALL